MDQLYKFEMRPEVVKYLLQAVNTQQIRGVQAAQDLIAVVNFLNSPLNTEDLEKEQLESLKAKYEPITEEKKKK